MVVGHKNPDTDSICSAIAYAHYKQQVHDVPARAYRAGNLNPQTSFVLSRFRVDPPELLTSLETKVSDIMIRSPDLLILEETDTLGAAQEIITARRFSFLPVRSRQGKYIGKISALRLAGLTKDIAQLSRQERVDIDVSALTRAVDGKVICGELPQDFAGRIWFQGLTPCLPGERLLAILPQASEAAFQEACDRGAAVIVIGRTPGPVRPAAIKQGVAACVLTTERDLLDIATHCCLAMPLAAFVDRDHPTLKPDDLIREARQRIQKYNEGGFIVVDENELICGVMTRVNFLSQWRFRVALVDHNELSQAVDGIEAANVEEIVDHHRLGYRSTDQPMTFINRVVGCTATIIAELYQNAHQEPPAAVAGLMLAAILSDTVILRSPTTTALDRAMAQWLSQLAGLDVQAFGAEMFAAGCAAESMEPARLIAQDAKVYEEGQWKFSVSQMETVGFDSFRRVRQALATELDRARAAADCRFSCLMITDITGNTSLLLCAGDVKFIEAITYPRVGENLFEMHGVLSRKKQMIPYLMDVVRGLGRR